MVVSDNARKCVVFVGYVVEGKYKFAGTAFWVGRTITGFEDTIATYLITAKHVIEKIKDLGIHEILLRVNLADGKSVPISVPINLWRFHPTDKNVDVAILNIGMPDNWDHLMLPLTMFTSAKLITDHQIGVGDEVFITGLFRHHHGHKRNVPIIRIGNIAAMDEELVTTQEFGPISAYLIEARSIGGLSGSPVFVNLGVVRKIDGEVRMSKGGDMVFFLGLIHGHFDVSTDRIDGALDPSVEHVNTGIAIVIPYYKIEEALNHPDFIKGEEEIARRLQQNKLVKTWEP